MCISKLWLFPFYLISFYISFPLCISFCSCVCLLIDVYYINIYIFVLFLITLPHPHPSSMLLLYIPPPPPYVTVPPSPSTSLYSFVCVLPPPSQSLSHPLYILFLVHSTFCLDVRLNNSEREGTHIMPTERRTKVRKRDRVDGNEGNMKGNVG